MKDRWILTVAFRHFRTRRREKGHTASVLSVGGIAAGVMTLVAVLSVMNGFQVGTINDILELNSYHLRVRGAVSASEVAAVRGVRAVIPFLEIPALVRGYFADAEAAAVRALPAGIQEMDAGFAESLEVVGGTFDLATERAAVVGEELARRMGIRVGDTVGVVSFAGENLAGDEATLLVVGLFKSGFLEFDAGWLFVSLDTAARELGDDSPPALGVKLVDRFADRAVAARMPEGAEVESWRDFNRAIFSALRLEKMLMMVLVGLIFVVVGVNIFQSLRRSVVERTEEIGVLKAVGARPEKLKLVFVVEGLWIGLAGATVGTLLGLAVAVNINGIFALAELVLGVVWPGSVSIFSPAYFYLDEVPSVVLVHEVIATFVFALTASTVAALGASARVVRINPADVLRYE